AMPRSFSYWPTVPKLEPPKADDWPGNMLGACERAASQVTLVMRPSAISGATANAAATANAMVLMKDLLIAARCWLVLRRCSAVHPLQEGSGVFRVSWPP